ncbi:MAG: M16 family metallopeptidase [Planctomycetota bacterium]|jgi:predicted Zn-dependent peptidase
MPVEFKRATLPNGLAVIGEVDPDAHTAAVGFFVKSGARDEDRAQMGVSHFLEHMMFKGTESRTAADVDRDFDAIGADHNAFTTSEMTAFWAHVLPEHLPRAVEILADILRPALRQEDFDDEKGVILEEIAMYEDQPFWVLYERTMEAYYRAFPLSHRVLGTRQTIECLTRRQMLEYFGLRYSADNTTVALAGRLDFDEMRERLTGHCGRWEATQADRRHPTIDITSDELEIRSQKVTRHYAIMATPAPSAQDERRYAAALLAQILGSSEGSRLYWALVETGLAEEVRAQYEGHDGVGEFIVYWTCSADEADTVQRVVYEQIDELVNSLTEEDLGRIRSKVATAATLQGELPAGRMQRLGRLWTYLDGYRSLEEELRRINAVTLDDLQAVYLSTIISAVAASPDLGISREYAIDPAPTHDEKHRTHPTTRAVRQDLVRRRREPSDRTQ